MSVVDVLVRWFVYGCFALTWLVCLGFMAVGDGPEFVVAFILFVVVPFVYIPMIEELEG